MIGIKKQHVQKYGNFLSAMVMPNIPAFIAWGLLSAFFVSNGWYPNAKLALMLKPIAIYLLPILIAYTGGKIIAKERGGIVGAIGIMGLSAGSHIPMFLGAMIIGPVGGILIKTIDNKINKYIPSGFEMLINNFSLGIIGALLAIVCFMFIHPFLNIVNNLLLISIKEVMILKILPFLSILIEPAKVLFLNNVINQGILVPIGLQSLQHFGKSILFILEENPGPGLGVLIAYSFFGKGKSKLTAPSAIVIEFFGGIQEIYFPYVLINPLLFLAVIAGGVSGTFIFQLFHVGLIAPASPGSIFAILALTPKYDIIPVLFGITISTIISFIVAAILLKYSNQKKSRSNNIVIEKEKNLKNDLSKINIKKILFVCNAGMGSSVMGASILKKMLREKNINNIIINCSSINEVNQFENPDIIIIAKSLANCLKSSAYTISVNNFYKVLEYNYLTDIIIKQNKNNLKKIENKSKLIMPMFSLKSIKMNCNAYKYDDAILESGKMLYDQNKIEYEYILGMQKREKLGSTYLGNGIAIPHGTHESKELIKSPGIVVLQYPNGILYNNEKIFIVFGLASKNDLHIELLNIIATIAQNDDLIKKIRFAKSPNLIYNILYSKLR